MTSCINPHHHHSSWLLLVILFLLPVLHAQTQRQVNNTGFSCSSSSSSRTGTNDYPCQAYAFYRANLLDLAAIADLFSVSRLMIAKVSNISSPSSPLLPDQPLFVPLSCSCNSINTTFGSISYANISYTIKPNDTFFLVSSTIFQNLTTYPSVQLVNPHLLPTNLSIGDDVVFPLFCNCPNKSNSNSNHNIIISYVVQPSDNNFSSIASRFGATEQSIIDANGGDPALHVYDTIFIPVTRLPVLSQPTAAVVPSPPPGIQRSDSSHDDRSGTVKGLAAGLGITGLLLILMSGLWMVRARDNEKKQQGNLYLGGGGGKESVVDAKLMASVSDCLDKYRVFGIEELMEATDGFGENCLIQGSVYRGTIDGEVYAIKKMSWNAYDELKILQKVNHGNLVKLEGFCTDPEEANCFLVYEYVENGSLYSWLHVDNKNKKLNWKTRLRIAIDIANGLQYIHEHTRPRVVHKDIKSSNILLDANMRAKIANFGLAKSGINAITMHIVGTQGYIAPEYLADGMVSTKMDVFSFGVVLLELVSGKEAIDEKGNQLWESAIKTFEVSNEQEKGERLREWLDNDMLRETCSMESLIGVVALGIACLHRDPTKRPSIVDIVYTLSKSEDSVGFDVSDECIVGSPRVMAR